VSAMTGPPLARSAPLYTNPTRGERERVDEGDR
jgi:hypothetical protein